MRPIIPFVTFLLSLLISAPVLSDDDEAWAALREGRAVLMLRHALAPGTGDPAEFELGDCSTQRNLNETGRKQARAWTSFLENRGISQARVFSSQWCRAMETAEAMGLGDVQAWPVLNSFFRHRTKGPEQTGETIARVNQLEVGLPVILVSHQVNVTALTGVFPASNEGVIVSLPLSDNPDVLVRVSPGR